MIRLLREGTYELLETKAMHKLLLLDNEDVYAWIDVEKGMYQLLVSAHHRNEEDHLLATGRYRLYAVRNEIGLADMLHLELLAGHGKWQGYLLTTGFPTSTRKRTRIIPTKETITKVMH